MKLGYRDRIILLVVLVVVIFGVGIFVFIKPQWQKLSKNKQKFEEVNKAWDAKLIEFEQINAKRTRIMEKRDKAYDLSLEFTDEMDAIQLDQFLQEKFINTDKFKEDKVKLTSALSVSDEATASLGYYFYTPKIVTYPLYENADFDGSIAEATAKKLLESVVLGLKGSQTVGSGKASFTIQCTREDTDLLIDAVREYAVKNKDAMILESISIAEYDFNGEPNGVPTVVIPAPGEGETPAAAQGADVTPGYTDVTFNFIAYYMQEPTEVKEKVGPVYNPEIWKSKKWKEAGSATPENTTEAK